MNLKCIFLIIIISIFISSCADYKTAKNANCGSVFVGNSNQLNEFEINDRPDLIVPKLSKATQFIKKYYSINS